MRSKRLSTASPYVPRYSRGPSSDMSFSAFVICSWRPISSKYSSSYQLSGSLLISIPPPSPKAVQYHKSPIRTPATSKGAKSTRPRRRDRIPRGLRRAGHWRSVIRRPIVERRRITPLANPPYRADQPLGDHTAVEDKEKEHSEFMKKLLADVARSREHFAAFGSFIAAYAHAESLVHYVTRV